MEAGGNLERREMFAAEMREGFGARIRSGQDDLRFHDLAEVRMGAAKNAGFADGGVAVQHGFYLLGKHFPSREIDDGGLARDEIEKTFTVNAAKVAGDEPAIVQDILTRLPRRGVGVADARPRHGDLANALFIRRQHFNPKAGERFADGIPTLPRVIVVQRDEAEFDDSEGGDKRPAEALEKFCGDILRQGAGGRDGEADGFDLRAGIVAEIGRASCRERV